MELKNMPEDLKPVVAFHGHLCPGVLIGYRASKAALEKLRSGRSEDEELVAIVENDSCSVDAVQFMTGATFGKGNLIHRDHGKMAFTFYDRESEKGFRCILKPEARGDAGKALSELSRRIADGTAGQEEAQRVQVLRQQMQERIMTAELDAIFEIMAPLGRMPRPARVLESLACEMCGEATMESRTRRFAGKILCQPCFDTQEQKV